VEVLSVADGIRQYRFPPHEGQAYGFNVLALLDETEKTAWLIDTAYEAEAAEVRRHLEADGYRITGVVLSHFHPDHTDGLKALPQVERIGSPRAAETLAMFGDREEWEPLLPTRAVDASDVVRFGPFELRFLPAPGHSDCCHYTLIDERYVHVADNVMTSNDGQDILPWAPFEEIEAHIRSLELLRSLEGRTALLSHGVTIEASAVLHEAIDNRIAYFQAVHAGDGQIDIEQATADCTCDFLCKQWLIRKDA